MKSKDYTAQKLVESLSEPIIPMCRLLSIKERFKELEKENNENSREDLSKVERVLNKIKDEHEKKLRVLGSKNKIKLLQVNKHDANPFAFRELLSLTFYFLPFYERVLLRTLSKLAKEVIDNLPILEEFIFNKDNLLIFNTINFSDKTNPQGTYNILEAYLREDKAQIKEEISNEVKTGKYEEWAKSCLGMPVIAFMAVAIPAGSYFAYLFATQSPIDLKLLIPALFSSGIYSAHTIWKSCYIPCKSMRNAASFFATFSKNSADLEKTPLVQDVVVEDLTDEQEMHSKI